MPGLRERKKENNRQRIFDSALKLFEEQGFEKTTMERIALEADLGVGTLYNYFPSKMEILFSIIGAGSGRYFEALDEIIGNASDLGDAVNAFYAIYLRSFSTYGKKVWREMFSEIFRQPDFVKMIDSVDSAFIDRLKALLSVFAGKGYLRKEVSMDTAASALYGILAYQVIRYAIDREMTQDMLLEQLRAQSALVVGALSEG